MVITDNHQGIYQLEIKQNKEFVYYCLDLSTDKSSLRKKKVSNPDASFQIKDDNLMLLFQKKLLLQEVKIQGRIKLYGEEKYQKQLLVILSDFLHR